jgi:adenylyltransferase/sulfurtransferase
MSPEARFSFATSPLDPAVLRSLLTDPTCGGYVAFEGWVRNHNEGAAVTHLEYEAFEALGVSEGEKIIAEACAKFGVDNARCAHRVGALDLGDMAVWVGVSAAHRDEAFRACRYIIDEVKHRLPIWKKEHYVDGDSGWVNCERCAEHAQTSATAPTVSTAHGHAHRHDHGHDHDHGHPLASPGAAVDYSRQMSLPQVGASGQARLRASRVAVIGAGGLGVPVMQYLAGAGVGTLIVIDGDRLEASNLHRQTWYSLTDCGTPKAELAAARIRALNPDVQVELYASRLDATNGAQRLAGCDLLIDCTDNFSSKFLLNDLAEELRIPLILASVHQFEGQLQVVDPTRHSSCLRCIWPEATRDGVVGNCAEAGVLGPVPGVLGTLQALEALKILLDLPQRLRDELLLVDLLGLGISRVQAARNTACQNGCALAPAALAIAREKTAREETDLELHFEGLAAAHEAGYSIIDIRAAEERHQSPLDALLPQAKLLNLEYTAILGPPGDLPLDLKAECRYLLVCSRGIRSRSACAALRERGYTAVYSLAGGALGLGVIARV